MENHFFISSSFCSLEISTFDKSMFRDDRFPSNTSVLRGFSHAPTTGMKNPPLRYRSIQFLICHLKVPGRPPPNTRHGMGYLAIASDMSKKKSVFKNWGRQIAKIQNLEEIGIQDPCLKII